MRKKKRGIIAPSFCPSPPPLFPDTKSEKGPTFSIQNSRILCFECASNMGRAGLNKRTSKTAQNVSWALELCVYVTLGKWKAYKVTRSDPHVHAIPSPQNMKVSQLLQVYNSETQKISSQIEGCKSSGPPTGCSRRGIRDKKG